MARLWRAALKLSIYILVVLVALTVLGYRLLTKSLPAAGGEVGLAILKSPVDVYRDSLGVPHIFASNDSDLFRAAGYVTAQDRLWQMDFYRRAAAGRLSEIFGETTLAQDKLLRLWGFDRIAPQIVKTLSPDSRLALEAYAEGVNAFIESHRSSLPVEFDLLGYQPEPWRIEDSIAFTRLMAWKLSFSWYVDIVLAELVNRFGPAKAREVFPDYPANGPFVIPDNAAAFRQDTGTFLEASAELQKLLGISGAAVGSNAWVVSGSRTRSGAPLLANDPHLDLLAPSVWYQIHLSSAKMNVAGVALPGVPGIVIGRNKDIAWGLTNGMIDDVDFYLERVKDDSSGQYWDGSRWRGFSEIHENIHVKDAPDVEMTIRATENGPVISDLHPILKGQTQVVSMRWVGQTPSDELDAYLKLQRSANWQEFLGAVRGFKVPAQNFVFASRSGNIGYCLAGDVPVRKNGTGMLPHAGWRTAGKWSGRIPFEELPHAFNPAGGVIATANNKIVGQHYPYYLSNLWEPPGRASRILELIAGKDTLSPDYFRKMQLDVESVFARTLVQQILKIADAYPDSSSERLELVCDFLRQWDGRESAEKIAPSVFHAFIVKFLENTLKDEMGALLFQYYVKARNVPFRVLPGLLGNPRYSWFDDVSTPEHESRDDIVVKSLLDADSLLLEVGGPEVSDWRWGALHTLTMKHPLGVRPPLDFLLNIGPLKRGGSTMTINNSEYQIEAPFHSVVGPSMRQVVDLASPDEFWSVLPTGASGQRLSKHYKDQTELWQEGAYHRMTLNREQIAAAAPEHLVLLPETVSGQQ